MSTNSENMHEGTARVVFRAFTRQVRRSLPPGLEVVVDHADERQRGASGHFDFTFDVTEDPDEMVDLARREADKFVKWVSEEVRGARFPVTHLELTPAQLRKSGKTIHVVVPWAVAG